VVRKQGDDRRVARVLIWDDLSLDARSAEMIALPVKDRLEQVYGQGCAARVDVWQLEQPLQVSVTPQAAEARRAEVQAVLAAI
jgi:carotenoid cleavage dioxygenase-like enzyme